MPLVGFILVFPLSLLLIPVSAYAVLPSTLQKQVQDAVAQGVAPAMVIVGVKHGEILFEASAGLADPNEGLRIAPRTPLRQASIAKPYLAATLIQLADEKGIELDTPISALVPHALLQSLQAAGYQPSGITLDHLLTHTGGLRDHTASRRFKVMSFLLRGYDWTPQEQVEIMAGLGEPRWDPGQKYAYSDTGYVLLGQVVEALSGENLGVAVREYARLEDLGLGDTWWELMEQAPGSALPRARQYLHGWNVSGLNPSVDLFGGGGIIASPLDVALFFDALFNPQTPRDGVMRDERLLARMLGAGAVPVRGSYKRGISVTAVAGRTAYVHTGYWGTAAYHLPAAGITISGAVTDRDGMTRLREIIRQLITDIPEYHFGLNH